jgi:hypothetical protein
MPTEAHDALLARCLHVTLAKHKSSTLQDAWSQRPYQIVGDAEDILRAACILEGMGKLRLDPPVKDLTFTKAVGSKIDQWAKVLWVEDVSDDALWRAWDYATLERAAWFRRADVYEARSTIEAIDQEIAKLSANRKLWERRLTELTDAV